MREKLPASTRPDYNDGRGRDDSPAFRRARDRMHARRFVLWLSNLLIVGGAVLLVGTFGLLGYSRYEQYQVNKANAELAPAVPGAWTPVPRPHPTPQSQPTEVVAP